MKVVISTPGRFHSFDMARQLEARGVFEGLFTGYPKSMLRHEKLPLDKIHAFPYIQSPYVYLQRIGAPGFVSRALWWSALEVLDKHVSRNLMECDVFIALSSVGLRSGRVAKGRGASYVCDRGSAHIAVQNEILTNEYKAYGMEFEGVDPRAITKELAEYQLADQILVPSTFAKKTFIESGIPEEKLGYAPYGVDIYRFEPTSEPDPDTFEVLFVGIVCVRKGIRYLLEAFKNVKHPRKRLTMIGRVDKTFKPWLGPQIENLPVDLTGPLPLGALKHWMSRSHVMVLPSVEDGFGLVMPQAMACGCPVIASDHTGGPDLITEGVEGFTFPSRDVEALTHHLQTMADNPGLRQKMSRAAQQRVERAHGWDEYGERVFSHIQKLTNHNNTSKASPLRSTEPIKEL